MFLMTLSAMRKLVILFTLTNGTHSYKRLMPISFKYTYVPPAAPPITSVADILKTKRQGDMVTVSGLIRWDSEALTPQNS